jgi:purine-nucleoside phosphorylase
VLLPGDPGRALALATELLAQPRMFNHNRGLWGYTGIAADGRPLTIQSTGIGGPSATIVLEELIALGARRVIRVGTAGALADDLALGDLLIADRALAADGTSLALGGGGRVRGDDTITRAMTTAAPPGTRVGTIVSSDLFYEPTDERLSRWRADGAIAVEMEAASLFTLGALRGVAVGCALAITDLLGGPRRRIEPEALGAAGLAVGRLGANALRTS